VDAPFDYAQSIEHLFFIRKSDDLAMCCVCYVTYLLTFTLFWFTT